MYFVTFRVHKGKLKGSDRTLALDHIKDGDSRFYTLVACVIMPNHVHVIFLGDRGYSLDRIMKGMKGASARKINLAKKSRAEIWQHESFDRIIRSEKELHGKLVYMLNNPLKAGLTKHPWRYKWWYCNEAYFKR